MRNDKGGFLGFLDDVSKGESFARAGCPKQGLVFIAFVDALDKFIDGLRLVAGRFVSRSELKFHKRAYFSIFRKRTCIISGNRQNIPLDMFGFCLVVCCQWHKLFTADKNRFWIS